MSIGSYRGLRTVAHGGAWAGFRTHVVRVTALSVTVGRVRHVRFDRR